MKKYQNAIIQSGFILLHFALAMYCLLKFRDHVYMIWICAMWIASNGVLLSCNIDHYSIIKNRRCL